MMTKTFRKVLLRIIYSKVMRIVPDKIYLKLAYLIHTGTLLNLENPQKFTEKLQWLKINDRKTVYTRMADKLTIRNIVKEKMGDHILIPILSVWDNVEEIEFDKLPEQFVLKCNHDSGSAMICKSKTLFLSKKENLVLLKKKLSRNFYYYGREWPYKNITPKVFAEPLLSINKNDLHDYKVMCFNGIPKIIIEYSRYDNSIESMTYYDSEWNYINVRQKNHPQGSIILKPSELSEMLRISKSLSKGIPFLRVDFLICKNRLYFGETTFYPSSGFVGFVPEEYDYLFGSWIDLSEKRSSKNG